MTQKVLLLGSGGRESALCHSLCLSNSISTVFVSPGNPGMVHSKVTQVQLATNDSYIEIVAFCKKEAIDMVIPGSEVFLCSGITDILASHGITTFGPSSAASEIEGNKSYSKSFMKKYGIKTAEFQVFDEFESAVQYVKEHEKIVIKVSGLAAGKGVLMPQNTAEALDGLRRIFKDNEFGNNQTVVIEELLEGVEISLLLFTDGYSYALMPACQDHKRIFDGDKGPNTGGMGAYCPSPMFTAELKAKAIKQVVEPTLKGLRNEGRPFKGVLYIGLMITNKQDITVLEYNARFGDPETQVLLPLLKSDIFGVMQACYKGTLDCCHVEFSDKYAVTVVAASSGYPGNYSKGDIISLPSCPESSFIFHAGTKTDNGNLVTSGGRVLSVTCVEPTLENALQKANSLLAKVDFKGIQFRKDIAQKAIDYLKSSRDVKTTYADAGVSIANGNSLVELIKPLVKATGRIGASTELGGFGGCFDLAPLGYADPILVSGTDGVGTKLKVAHIMDSHKTIGIDLVGMSVNDVLVQGAEPLFFLDYFATSNLDLTIAKDVVSGIATGCKESGCALIGGETAEMPGMYQPGDYDLAGFVVGIVERADILPKFDTIKEGDIVLGLPSSGLHSNGYSLVRHIIDKCGFDYKSPAPFDPTKSIGDVLLTPTRLYVKTLLPLIKTKLIKSMAHITGGGFTENIPRALPTEFGVDIKTSSYTLPPLFDWLKEQGNIDTDELYKTFNCGVGMVIIVAKEDASKVIARLGELNETVYDLGYVKKISPGDRKVTLL